MLTITNVRKTFNKGTINEKKALNGINLNLESGDFVTILYFTDLEREFGSLLQRAAALVFLFVQAAEH